MFGHEQTNGGGAVRLCTQSHPISEGQSDEAIGWRGGDRIEVERVVDISSFVKSVGGFLIEIGSDNVVGVVDHIECTFVDDETGGRISPGHTRVGACIDAVGHGDGAGDGEGEGAGRVLDDPVDRIPEVHAFA